MVDIDTSFVAQDYVLFGFSLMALLGATFYLFGKNGYVEVLIGKYVFKTHRIRKKGEPPIVYGDPKVGVNDLIWGDPWGFLKECRSKHGEIFTLRIATNNTDLREYQYQTFVMDPTIAYTTALGSRNVDKEPTSRQALQRFGCKQLLSTRQGVFSLGRHLRHACIHDAYGDLFFSIQANTKKLAFSSLSGQTWPPLADTPDKSTDLEGKGEFIRTVERLAFRVMVESMYGEGVASDELENAFLTIHHHDPVLQRMRIAGQELNWKADKLLEDAETVLQKALSDKAQLDREGTVSPIILHMDAIAEEFHLPREEAYQLKKGMMWAALLNVQQVCVWTFLTVFHDKKVLEALRNEIKAARESSNLSPSDLFERSKVMNMSLLDMVIWETLRVYSRSNLIRVSVADHEVKVRQAGNSATSKYAIRKNDWVASFPREFHHSEAFVPVEWDPLNRKVKSAKVYNKIMQNAMYAFGMGNGQCPAYKFGVDAVKIMLIHLVENYDFEFDMDGLPKQEKSGVHAVPCPIGPVNFRLVQLDNKKKNTSGLFKKAGLTTISAMRWKKLANLKYRSETMRNSLLSVPDHYEFNINDDEAASMAKDVVMIDVNSDDIYYVMLKLPHDALRLYLKRMANCKIVPSKAGIQHFFDWYPTFYNVVLAHISLSKECLYFPWTKALEIPKSSELKENHHILVKGMADISSYISELEPRKNQLMENDYLSVAAEIESKVKGLATKMMSHLALEEVELPDARRSVARGVSCIELSFLQIMQGIVENLLSSVETNNEGSVLFLSLIGRVLETGTWKPNNDTDTFLEELDSKMPEGWRKKAIDSINF